tara:strand:- start:340 stop:927 length:588 start_codon:yes stop_codon:yes gene_type:complete
MRPRNVLTETNNMRKLMGLPLLKEDGGNTIKDIKKKVLNESTIEYEDDQWLVIDKEDEDEDKDEEDKDEVNEDRGFSLGFGNQGGLTIAEEDLDETTEAKARQDKGDGAPENDVVEEQLGEEGEGPLGINGDDKFDVDNASVYGDGEVPLDQVVAEENDGVDVLKKSLKKHIFSEDKLEESIGFAKYNITLHDKL